MALTGALCAASTPSPASPTKAFAGSSPDSSARTTHHQMTYDLRRLRLHGLIERIPHTNTYILTPQKDSASPSSTPSSDRLLDRCSKPTNHPHPSDSAAP